MKKLLVVLLTLALCISLASCEFINNIINGQQQEEVEYNAAAAADYVYNLYKNKSVTAADFEVTAVANIAGVKHTVEWSVNTDKVTITKKNDTTYIVNVDEESAEELAYVLTATVKGGDQVATKTFNLTVPKYELTSFEAYMAAKEGDNVVVKGIVVAINSKSAGNKYNHLFLADLEGKGGYYCYSMATDPIADDGIELGMTVEVSGPVTPYSGMQEIKGGTVRIVDSSKKDVAVLDITEKVANGESLAKYVGLPVTIKGVEIAGQELDKETSQYLNFKVGEKTAYVRTYVTDFPTTLPVAEKANIDAAHAEHFGWTANATGILVLYNSNPYLIPMGTDCFEYLNKIEKTAEQKIADTLAQLTIGSLFNTNTEITLPAAGAAYTDVALAWTTSDATNAAIADGKLTIVIPNTAVEVTITVTATCEGKTATKEYTITMEEAPEYDFVNVAGAVTTAPGTDTDPVFVTVKGIVGPSLVNKTGFYLIDKTGVIAVETTAAVMETIEIGHEVVIEAKRGINTSTGKTFGQTCLKDAKVVVNNYGSHAYSSKTFVTGKTLADFAALDVTKDYSTTVFIVKARVEVTETPYYTSIALTDGTNKVTLYSSSAKQYSWLQAYAGQEITLELAACNWNDKTSYKGCVLAVVLEDGTKVLNTLNFK